MNFVNEPIFQWLSQYAYEPHWVYVGIFAMMIGSGFGVPIPEEVTIVSVGLLTYMGGHPEMFPPPTPGAPVVKGIEAAVVTLFAVLFADGLVFSLGRLFGRKLFKLPRFKKFFDDSLLHRINSWLKRYGIYTAFLFRFTPGIRFPAHIILGMSKFPAYQFILVDLLAAAISVPTQILLIAHYGEPILMAMHRFKIWIFSAIAALVVLLLLRKAIQVWFRRPQTRGKHPSE